MSALRIRCGRSSQASPPAVKIIKASSRDAVRLSDSPLTNLISMMLPGLANSSPPFAFRAAATRMARPGDTSSTASSTASAIWPTSLSMPYFDQSVILGPCLLPDLTSFVKSGQDRNVWQPPPNGQDRRVAATREGKAAENRRVGVPFGLNSKLALISTSIAIQIFTSAGQGTHVHLIPPRSQEGPNGQVSSPDGSGYCPH
jgi:hypothetical protein